MHLLELKMQAKDRMRNSVPNPIVAAIIFVAITIAVGLLSYQLTGKDLAEFVNAIFEKYYGGIDNFQYIQTPEFIENFDYQSFFIDLTSFSPDPAGTALDALLRIMSLIVGAGFMLFCLNTVRRSGETSYWNVFDSFRIFGKLLLLYISEAVIIALWSLLLIFPGIIAYYRYSLAVFLLLDDPDKGVFACMRESSQLMKGRKMERFSLDLSFIGWFLLMSFAGSLGAFIGISFMSAIVGIWVYPFYHLTSAGFYDAIVNPEGSTYEI